jgi:hypothetical protein
MQGLSLVEVASRRASPDRLALLVSTTEKERPTTAAGVDEFEHEFWSLLAAIGKNRIFMLEVAWWRNVFPDRPIPQEVASAEPDARMAFYRELARRLRDRDHPVEYYIAAVRPILDGVLSRASQS